MLELLPNQTAICLHWPYHQQADQCFLLTGIHTTQALDPILDALLEEHVPDTTGTQEVLTEITIWRCFADGTWQDEEIVSHYYAET